MAYNPFLDAMTRAQNDVTYKGSKDNEITRNQDGRQLANRVAEGQKSQIEYGSEVAKFQNQFDKSGFDTGQQRNTDIYNKLGAEETRLKNQRAPTAGYAQKVYGDQAQAATLGDAMTGRASQAQTVGRTDLGLAQGQNDLIGNLQAAANGQGPSLAQGMLQQGREQGIKGQMAMAASLQGRGNPALGARNAMMGAAQINQDAARQASQTGLQEQMAARDQLGGALSQARAQEQNYMGMGQQTNLANAQLAQQMDMYNVGNQNDFRKTNAAMQQQANMATSQNNQNANMLNSQLQNQVNLGNLQSQYGTQNANNALISQQIGAQGNLAQNYAANSANWENMEAADFRGAVAAKEGKDAQTAQNVGSVIGGVASIMALSDETKKEDIEPVATDNNFLDKTLSGLGDAFTFKGLRDTYSTTPTPLKLDENIPGKKDSSNSKKDAAAAIGKLGSTLGTMFATSDEKKKTDVSSDDSELNSFLDAMHPKSWHYKEGSGVDDGKRHYGVMAQNLEETPMGKGAVVDTPNGKMVDYGQLAGTMLASQALLNKKLNAQEQAIKSVLGKRSGKK